MSHWLSGVDKIWIDPSGFVCMHFATWNARADFLQHCVPPGHVFANLAINLDGPPHRLTFNFGKFESGPFELKRDAGIGPATAPPCSPTDQEAHSQSPPE